MKVNDIEDVVRSFYNLAMKDFLIGYQFRKINNLNEPKIFEEHIKRITSFWELQLTGNLTEKSHLPFKLIEVHLPLNIKSGELGRWELLFNEVLDKSNLSESCIQQWKLKIRELKKRMLAHPTLFKTN